MVSVLHFEGNEKMLITLTKRFAKKMSHLDDGTIEDFKKSIRKSLLNKNQT